MKKSLLLVTAIAIAVSGCKTTETSSKTDTKETTTVVGQENVLMTDSQMTDEVIMDGIDDGSVMGEDLPEIEEVVETLMVTPPATVALYFDFNSYALTEDSQLALIEHVDFLANNEGYKLILQGHADERGTREYNLALGLDRADGVKNYLMSQNVLPSQLESTSFGEEKLANNNATNSMQHGQNRRVELLYIAL
jgi:peptidoglycan-associated lipoprotein